MRAALVAALLSVGCVQVIDSESLQRAHRDRPTAVRLDRIDPQTLDDAASVWAPLGVTFVAGDRELIARLGDDMPPEDSGIYTADDSTIVLRYEDPMILAHELGHALGLQHVSGCSVMSASTCSPALTDEDIAEFHRTARP